MKIGRLGVKGMWKLKLSAAKIALSMVLLTVLTSGCVSVLRNSEAFYKDRPQRLINWKEYTS
jgi:hypothetical protein